METPPTPTTPLSTAAAHNINHVLRDQGITKNTLALKAGIPVTSLYRKLDNRPDQFTLKEIGDIAEALNVRFEDLLKVAA